MKIDKDQNIECVHKSTRDLIFKKYWFLPLLAFLICIIIVFFDIEIAIWTFFSIFVVLSLIAHHKAHIQFMKQFAERNNFSYQRSDPISSVKGSLFQSGHSRRINNVIGGKHKEHDFRLFNYQYTRHYGRHSVTYKFTVFETSFHKTEFPHIFLYSKNKSTPLKKIKMGMEVLTRRMNPKLNQKKDLEIELEGEFKGHFRLYVAEGYGIEAMQIFTKENLEFLRKIASNFSIELIGDKLYIYDDLWISKAKQLQEMYEVVQRIVDSLGPLLGRLQKDFQALHPYFQKKN